ncbi:hypothetical protein DLM45_10275 [Hyphomicrobium methylovorum]|uniref:hypothetical protein n=1 Tax=Hyphomicrobium methylovorum TaxID=84 RepID=UPI0015E7B97E|nr:hypothetical protein [Hyphomicrobium methylovorum]MBA2126602.1 hypothetical protein [Hyphomicrobium methylovorum]
MRIIVIMLALLACFKVWSQDRTYRSVMGEALANAYSERALEACRKASAPRTQNARITAAAWGRETGIETTLGNADVDVAIWDTQNPLWSRRFRDPYLVLTSATAGTRCAYDVTGNTATLSN